jgi:hypothetical protein
MAKSEIATGFDNEPASSRAVEILPVIADAVVWISLVLCVVGLLFLCGKDLATAF